MATRVEGIEERVNETAQLSLYLTDQVEALDKLLGRVGDLPMKLEGVVAQALRRTLATRAKLDKEAEGAIDDVLGAVDEQLEHFSASLQRFAADEGQLHKIELGQADLSSRLESLQANLTARLDESEKERRRTEQELARAIDRTAKGLDPRALDSLKARGSSRGAKAKTKAKVTKRTPPQAQSRRKAKTSSRRTTRRSPGTTDDALD
jgi:septation ring formation regulator EzrA